MPDEVMIRRKMDAIIRSIEREIWMGSRPPFWCQPQRTGPPPMSTADYCHPARLLEIEFAYDPRTITLPDPRLVSGIRPLYL